jgi:hypothetical protein
MQTWRKGIAAVYLLAVAYLPGAFGSKQGNLCEFIETDIKWFVYLMTVILFFNLAVIIAFSFCNLVRRRQLLVAASLNWWFSASQIMEGIVMFIGYPAWFITTLTDHDHDNIESCKVGWDWLNFVNFLFLSFYTATPTIVTAVLICYLFYKLPALFNMLR